MAGCIRDDMPVKVGVSVIKGGTHIRGECVILIHCRVLLLCNSGGWYHNLVE